MLLTYVSVTAHFVVKKELEGTLGLFKNILLLPSFDCLTLQERKINTFPL